uniref:PITH domain-containing protein n=1 Tax=Octactis speculum TaxID=3111310 RepID=A0A7S2DSZ5_9STRA|mmetsp:Transcript_53188/g.72642  ORF Transcript_53188/g.72642 Transcript_53188/m.72642 type:complete len:210 (+) Transcript_53188:56-685(+)|eukprot:CAMPEP_0185749986 /NCGR_PEP_ID=MMETSP1174-20130828/8699_1 /TAXON_ID=35687 /ORGANISM="Dictyocha speculum, Strain CCMP1381" /LENGTH=209 /DNA_ID=CAMNT_0028426331 /DNA_START=56 /DNA_END=685 /DNA_ORIENTATION=-
MGRGGHGGGFSGGGHSHNPDAPEDDWNLYQHIERCEVLNCTRAADGPGIFKPFAYRLEEEPCVKSDGDEELLIKLSFSSPVHIRRIMIIGGGDEEYHPSHMKAYINRPELDFSGVNDVDAVQEWDLSPNATGEGYVVTRQAPFTNVTEVAFFITGNCGDIDETWLQYVGLQGDHTHDRREAVNATYEAMGQLADHPSVPGEQGNRSMLG